MSVTRRPTLSALARGVAAGGAIASLLSCRTDGLGPGSRGGTPATILARLTSSTPIENIAQGATLPLECEVFDRNGQVLPGLDPVVTASRIGPRATCSTFRVTHSGLDTLVISAGLAITTVPVTLAILPQVSSSHGDFLTVDSVPSSAIPWVVSARRNTRGQIELYVAMLVDPEGAPFEDLHRYVSDDNGRTFRYDGLVLAHDPSACTLTGFGIENVAVVSRVEAPGWRMYFSGGQFHCYGWQVFSAVSSDERTWQIEPGVRLSNTADGRPAEDGPIPWPVGEGMVVDRLSSGGWRMLVGGYEHTDPPGDKFQIVEWLSPDQVNWRYVDTRFTTRQMPPEGEASVYSPTIREFAPGLWRMIFAGDNRNDAEGRGRLWSAVSTDLRAWQLEGVLIQSDVSDYYYSSLVDDFLVFIRDDSGLPPFQGDPYLHRLAGARILMP